MQIERREHAAVGDDAGDEVRRGHIERRIIALHALGRRAHAHGLQGKLRVAHLDFDGVLCLVTDIRRAGDEGRNAEVIGADGNLQCADLVDDVAVEADRVRRAGEQIHVLALHDERGHVVGDDGHVEAHVTADRGGEARALEIRPRLGAEQADVPAAVPALAQHRADDRLGEAVRHHRSVVGEHID